MVKYLVGYMSVLNIGYIKYIHLYELHDKIKGFCFLYILNTL